MTKLMPILIMMTLVSACFSKKANKRDDDDLEITQQSPNKNSPIAPPAAALQHRQIERLARPGVNEALVIDNDKLLAFNSIPPNLDLAVNNPTVLAVLQQAATALGLYDSLDGSKQFADGFDSNVVKGFLPDVMRIDTSNTIAVNSYAYNGAAVVLTQPAAAAGAVILTGGRKIEDDTIDITLSYLVTGNPGKPTHPHGFTISDNVSYEGIVGNSAQGHKKLHGQSTYRGSASFPFLAAPY